MLDNIYSKIILESNLSDILGNKMFFMSLAKESFPLIMFFSLSVFFPSYPMKIFIFVLFFFWDFTIEKKMFLEVVLVYGPTNGSLVMSSVSFPVHSVSSTRRFLSPEVGYSL